MHDSEQARLRQRGLITRRALIAGASALGAAAMLSPPIALAQNSPPAAALILLGTQGGPNFFPTRGETASALQLGERLYLVDCGYGALAGLYRAGLAFQAIDAIFLTHLHDDHTTDLFAILTHMATQSRTRDVTVYGPPGTNAFVDALRAALGANATIRIADEARPDNFLSFIKSVELTDGAPVSVAADVRVSYARNTHFPEEIGGLADQRSYAYRFDFGRSVVFSGDTSWSEGLVALARGADVLVCEVLEPKAMRQAFDKLVAGGAFKGAEEGVWRHMLATHATPDQVGRMAAQAGVGRLVLNHLAPGALLELPDSAFKDGIAAHYNGPVTVGHDAMRIPI